MAISLAISITRFQSQNVDAVKSGREVGAVGRGWEWGGAILAQ